ncbi:SusC/RagA family TonB-linked outer membrane protein [Thermoflavifilum thermophilum]|uniref:TonB-linked outer membrane protein, SusC/RagA family n=1 Tax=Thermoflavifilum thermophilum TaxID=1393122 RepID=A0A1I7MY24_9BACT|nr:SusC/RagA family TonB-linked outer membrane protein [Thermoflavifilum thermophilum]SFV27226.1 TonB-linked outer membrane protein, SusC/RagA family [Thermoflavifilum thermophilum]
MKSYAYYQLLFSKPWKKISLIMRITTVLMLIFFLQVSARSYSQNERTFSFNFNSIRLGKALSLIEKQSQYRFLYNNKVVEANHHVNLQVKDASIDEVLHQIIPEGLTFQILPNHVVVILPAGEQVQVIRITGVVRDSAGRPLAGVTVKIKDTNTGTVTDAEGRFSIEVPDQQAVLVFTYVGYQTQEVPVSQYATGQELAVTLHPMASALNELVVVGYGTQRRSDITNAVTTIESKDFLKGAYNSPLQLIEGEIPGVVVSNVATADPNQSASVQIRGAASISAGNGPLIVIDGIPGGDLRTISYQDIASISVLRDAAASAIYGSRGANGVILIQTKKGQAGPVTVNYDGYIDHDGIAAKPEILSAEEFLAHNRDADYGARTDWYNALIRKNNIGQNHYVSVAGGSENSVFRISGNYLTKQAIDIASFRKEYGITGSFQQKAMDDLLEFNENIFYRITQEEYTNYDAFKMAVKLNPTLPIMDPNNPSEYNTLYGYDTYNPVQDLKTRENGADHTYSAVDLRIKFNILPNLNTEVSLSRQGHDRLGRFYSNSHSAESIQNDRTGRADLSDEKWTDYTFEWLGNYNLHVRKHDLQLLGGYSYQEFNDQGFSAENMDFPSDAFSYNNLGAGSWNLEEGRLGMSSWKSKEKTIAFLARANYNFNNTYYLSGSLRREGNTKFGPNNKWGNFPSLSAAWRLSRLSFLRDIRQINDLKIRLSYGVTGRSGFPRYTALARYTGYGMYPNENGEWIRVYGPANNYNPNLKWEKAISYDLGIDALLFNQRVNLSIDGFIRESKDLLSNYDVPVGTYVWDQMFVNVGTTVSKGIELLANVNVVNKENFQYSANISASYTRANLKSWSNQQFHLQYQDLAFLPSPGNPGYAYRLEEGTEIGSFYGYRYAGVDENGNILVWKNGVKGSEKIKATGEANADRDRTYIGHGFPRYELGFGNNINYKRFNLFLFFHGRFDYQILNLYQMYFGLQAEPNVNLLKDAYTRNGQIKSGKVICDYFLENGNYLKLANLSLSYSPKINLPHVNSIRIYGTIRNLFTLTKYTGLDPESVNVTGLTPGYGDLDVYPTTRTFTLGVNLILK